MSASLAYRHLRLFLPALSMLLLPASGCKRKLAEEAPEIVVEVRAVHPTQGPLAEEIAADAILAPISSAALSARISAPIHMEYVQRGAHVRRGQLLISLDDRDLRGSALDSSGAVTSAQANLTATTQTTIPEEVKKAELDTTQLKAALDVASRTARERGALYKQGALSGREADAAYAAEVQAQAAYDAAHQHACRAHQEGNRCEPSRGTEAEAMRGFEVAREPGEVEPGRVVDTAEAEHHAPERLLAQQGSPGESSGMARFKG